MLLINNRSAIHKQSNGKLYSISINKTGKYRIPIGYPNLAESKNSKNTAQTVFSHNQPICHKNSIFSYSLGDQAGNHGGIKSKTINGKAEFITHSQDVFIEGLSAVRAGDLMVSNNKNTEPMPLIQPSPHLDKNIDLSKIKKINKNTINKINWIDTGFERNQPREIICFEQTK